MAYGAELVWAWSDLINNASLHKLQKIDGGDCWAALSFSGGKILLLSWGSKNNGVAFINEDEKKELLKQVRKLRKSIDALVEIDYFPDETQAQVLNELSLLE